MALDPQRVRDDFPILSRTMNGKRLVYLDNAATTQKPRSVIQALVDYYSNYNANVHRGAYQLAEESTELFERAREKVSRFIGCDPEEVVFVRGATEAINLVAYSYGFRKLRRGDKVLTTIMEHHSNLVPWQFLRAKGVGLDFVGLTEEGELDMEELKAKIDRRVKLVAVTQMSNVLGTVNHVREIADVAHDAGSPILVDGAQSVPHMPVDVVQSGADFLAFSGHKMLGPMGIGVLFAKHELLEAMDPFHGGGDMIKTVELKHSTWNDVPAKFEAGTPDVAGAHALGVAIDYLGSLEMGEVRRHEVSLTRYALERLADTELVEVYGPRDAEKRGGVLSFNIEHVHPHDVATILDSQGVAVRAGHHCAQPLMNWLGVPATARASFYVYNTKEDVDALISAIEKVKEVFRLKQVSSA
jgi:cysteine desulfurase/selenocysteine lyase